MKIELVSIHIKKSPQAMPLAVAMLKAKLDSVERFKNRVETSISDFYLGQDIESIIDSILGKKPDMIGFSIYLWNRDVILQVAAHIKKRVPKIIICAGGAEAGAMPEILLNSGSFDFAVTGEGELAFTTAVEGVLSDEQLPENRMFSFPVKDLDDLPSPFLNGTIQIEKYEGVLWELSRGCPFKCDFCFESRGLSGVRRFSLERIESELRLFEQKKVTQVFVLDPTFNQDIERAKKILRMILRIAPSIHFTFEVRTEFIDPEMAELFAKVNCGLQIGLQSSDSAVLKCVNRSIDPAKFREKINILNRKNVVFGLDLIYGLPCDTLAGFRKSIDFAISLQPNNLDIFPLAVLPGTVLYEKAGSLGLDFPNQAPYIVNSTPDFSSDDMNEAQLLSDSCDSFYNKGRAVGWLFMVLETLNMKPSEFFVQFAGWIGEGGICKIQCDFVKDLFEKAGKRNLSTAMTDIIRYNDCLNRSMGSGFCEKHEGKVNLHQVFRLSPSTKFLTLNYDHDELLTIGEITLVDFVKHFKPSRNEIITYNDNGNARSMPLDTVWINLLRSLDGKRTVGQILKTMNMKNSAEAIEFIEFCAGSGIVSYLLKKSWIERKSGDPWGARTPVTDVKGRCPNH